MKKIFSLLALVSLSFTAASAANAFETSDEVIVFATHEVRAARQTDAEKRIEQSLASFRTQAARAVPLRVELPALHPVAQQERSEPTREMAAKHASRDRVRS